MTVGLIIGLVLSCFGAVALYICLLCVSKRKPEDADFRLLGLTALASAIWSLGFAVLFSSTDTNMKRERVSFGETIIMTH